MILEMGSLGLTAYNLYKQYRMHNGGKFFDVPETKKHLENISNEFTTYKRLADVLIEEMNAIGTTDSFQGKDADLVKQLMLTTETETLEMILEIHSAIEQFYVDILEAFKDIDTSEEAYISFDILDRINGDFWEMAYEYNKESEIAANKIEEYSIKYSTKYNHEIKVPDFSPGTNAFLDLCGEEDGNTGFICECQKKLVDFDENAISYLEELNLQEKLEEINQKLVSIVVAKYPELKSVTNLVSLEKQYKEKRAEELLESDQENLSSVDLEILDEYYNSVDDETRMYMYEYGFTKSEAELMVKAVNALNEEGKSNNFNDYECIEYTYGTLSALCISYDAKRWRMTTGQPTRTIAEIRLLSTGLTEQEILDLEVIINLQHASFTDEDLKKYEINISDSSFCKETNAKIQKRARDYNNDFAHSTVQITAFAHGDNISENNRFDIFRWAVDALNSSDLSKYTYTNYEISFKGDIDSGRYSEADFQSDVDAMNLYNRMIQEQNVSLKVWAEYYNEVSNDSKQRAVEFFENMGDGYADIGIINTSDVLEKETFGSDYIIEGNSTDIKTSKSIFMQWLLSIYEGVDYDFPE